MELLDKQAITELVYSYSRAVDRRDFTLLRSLYSESAIDDHGAQYCGPAGGYVDWLREASQHVTCMNHHVGNLIIGLEGEAVAYGEVYVRAYNRWPTESGGWEEFIQGLRYLDRYEKQSGRWLFAHRKVVVDCAELKAGFWDLEHPLLKGKTPGHAGKQDVSYQILPHPVFLRK